MTLVAVVFKVSRIRSSFKYQGGLLNPNKHYYVRRVNGNSNPLPTLQALVSK